MSKCFIMRCTNRTERECLEKGLFGEVETLENYYINENSIEPGDFCFLLNIDKDELIGIFKAISTIQMNIDSHAFKGKFPLQVEVEPLEEYNELRLSQASYRLEDIRVQPRYIQN